MSLSVIVLSSFLFLPIVAVSIKKDKELRSSMADAP